MKDRDTSSIKVFLKRLLQSPILSRHDHEYIEKTLNYCLKYFKHTALKHKSGFFLKALKDGFFSGEIKTSEVNKKKKQDQSKNYHEKKAAEELASAEKEQFLQKLREGYQTPELVEKVLAEQQGNRFIYPVMLESRKQGKINKYLQGYVDRKLVEEYGGSDHSSKE